MNQLMGLLLQFWSVREWRFDNTGKRIVTIERLEANRYEWRQLVAYVIF